MNFSATRTAVTFLLFLLLFSRRHPCFLLDCCLRSKQISISRRRHEEDSEYSSFLSKRGYLLTEREKWIADRRTHASVVTPRSCIGIRPKKRGLKDGCISAASGSHVHHAYPERRGHILVNPDGLQVNHTAFPARMWSRIF